MRYNLQTTFLDIAVMNYFDDSQLDAIADALVERGYLVADGLLPPALLAALLTHFDQLQANEFKAAGIGRQMDFQQQESIRSDKIRWIEPTTDVTVNFLHYMESLRVGINRRLYMGLLDYESHFAHYPVGAFYKKHMDAFRANRQQGRSNRVLSTVLYLNQDWQSESGGELVVYAEEGEQVIAKISPIAGRLVIFLSEKFPHEVLPATRERKSIAGWFRVNEGVL